MKKIDKNIVILTPGFPKNEADSTTIPALQLYVKALKEKQPSYNIKVITFQFPFTSKKYSWFGIDIFPLNGRNSRLKKILVWNKAAQLLKQFHREKKIDVIHSFWLGECAFIGQKIAKKKT